MISPFLRWLGCLLALSGFAGDAGVHPGAEALRNWPQWRRPLANGLALARIGPAGVSSLKNFGLIGSA